MAKRRAACRATAVGPRSFSETSFRKQAAERQPRFAVSELRAGIAAKRPAEPLTSKPIGELGRLAIGPSQGPKAGTTRWLGAVSQGLLQSLETDQLTMRSVEPGQAGPIRRHSSASKILLARSAWLRMMRSSRNFLNASRNP